MQQRKTDWPIERIEKQAREFWLKKENRTKYPTLFNSFLKNLKKDFKDTYRCFNSFLLELEKK